MSQSLQPHAASQLAARAESSQGHRLSLQLPTQRPRVRFARPGWGLASISVSLLVALLMIDVPSLPVSATDGPKSRLEHLKEREERDSANETYWRGKHRKLLKRQEKAELEVARTSEEYTRARRRRRNRGGPSDHALKALNEARDELKAANTALAEFYEDAPRKGAKPGWLRSKD